MLEWISSSVTTHNERWATDTCQRAGSLGKICTCSLACLYLDRKITCAFGSSPSSQISRPVLPAPGSPRRIHMQTFVRTSEVQECRHQPRAAGKPDRPDQSGRRRTRTAESSTDNGQAWSTAGCHGNSRNAQAASQTQILKKKMEDSVYHLNIDASTPLFICTTSRLHHSPPCCNWQNTCIPWCTGASTTSNST